VATVSRATAIVTTALLLASACGDSSPPPKCPTLPLASASPAANGQASLSVPASPTVDDARRFVEQLDVDMHRLMAESGHANWAYETNITDDTEALATQAEDTLAEYLPKAIAASRRFDGLKLPDDVARQILLLRQSPVIPAPSNAAERGELTTIETWLRGEYGKGQYCPPAGSRLARLASPSGDKKCLHIDEIAKVLRTSHDWDELVEAWNGWHSIGAPMKDKYARYVELGNKGAKEIGYNDVGELWRDNFDMKPEDFEADVERLWTDVKPMYDELHCYVRGKLRAKYGKDKVPEHAPIPTQILGDLWAQEWGHIYDLVEPFKGEPSLDVDKKLREKKYDATKMVKLGESFFTSLGFDALPDSFWKRSQLTRPRDREVVCHASAWDVTYAGDLRVKMCIEPTEQDLITIHHELGHVFYYQRYFKLPVLFQTGANDGFHEGIGDTLALSVTPAYLKGLGLLDATPKGDHGRINTMMKSALEKVAFLPFGLLIDKWRWDVFSGKIPKGSYNAAWWDMKKKYQGVAPPEARTEADFDPGAKFHVPGSTPYIRYFLARIYQFQFHRALCKAAGQTGPLDTCSIYGNKAAGQKLMAMLALGKSKPWPEAMAALGAESKGDASAMLEYYAPLRAFLKAQNKGAQCGW
jgi:peptidyl-dipeptidase A